MKNLAEKIDRWLINVGVGAFMALTGYAAGIIDASPDMAYQKDINGDGKADFIVESKDQFNGKNEFNRYGFIQNEDGSLTPLAQYRDSLKQIDRLKADSLYKNLNSNF